MTTISPTLTDLTNQPYTLDTLSTIFCTDVVSIDLVDGSEIHQSNSESALLKIMMKDTTTITFFAKKVTASLFPVKKWPDMRRTLCYMRNEIVFYKDFLPTLSSRGVQLPSLLGEMSDFAAIGDGHMHCEPGTRPSSDIPLGGILFLSFLPPSSFYQNSPLSFDEVTQTLKAIAALHASGWEDSELLERLSKATGIAGSYTLANRNPIEVGRVASNWSKYLSEFSHCDPEFVSRSEIMTLGYRVQKIAEWVASQLSATPSTPLATIQHGDFKAMNVFLSKSDSDGAVLIDFASCGVGLPMSDISMHLCHAIPPSQLSSPTQGEDAMLDIYFNELESRGVKIDRAVLTRQYQLGCVNYWRFMCGRFYGTSSPESYEKAKGNRNVALINRDVEAAFAFAAKCEGYVCAFEAEMGEN